MKKPPLGLMPHDIWREHRIEEIKAAMERYKQARKAVPHIWRVELQRLERGIL